MKLNKKVLIPVVSTAMGLSVIGGIAGAVAWYQYNSKTTASFVGASVADTGVLQIGTMEKVFDENGEPVWVDPDAQPANLVQKETIVWGRDFVMPNVDHLIPVTFGAMNEVKDPVLDDQNQPVDLDGNGIDDTTSRYLLPSKAYAYPESGCGEGYLAHTYTDALGREYNIPGWAEAREGIDYVQFNVYVRAIQTDASVTGGYRQVERDVFLAEYIARSVGGANEKFAHEALRVHIAANNGDDAAVLLANKEYKDSNPEENIGTDQYDSSLDGRLPLYGPLNLDRSNEKEADPNADENDKYHSSIWNDNLAAYGVHSDAYPNVWVDVTDDQSPLYPGYFTTLAGTPFVDGEVINYGKYGEKQITKSLALTKQERVNGVMPIENESGYENKLFTTKEDSAVKLTITIWLEGWEPMTKDGTHSDESMSPEWNPQYTAETSVQVGLQFDTGIFRENDLAA